MRSQHAVWACGRRASRVAKQPPNSFDSLLLRNPPASNIYVARSKRHVLHAQPQSTLPAELSSRT